MFSLGVNPATLVPEGIDLNFFPEFPVSEELTLKPSLSYSADAAWSRLGALSYAPPKRWAHHYGELVRLIARQDGRHKLAIGTLKPGTAIPGEPDESGDREGLDVEVQTEPPRERRRLIGLS